MRIYIYIRMQKDHLHRSGNALTLKTRQENTVDDILHWGQEGLVVCHPQCSLALF